MKTLGATTHEAVSVWHEIAEEALDMLADKLDEPEWMDLPPDTSRCVIATVNQVADLRDKLMSDMHENGMLEDDSRDD